MTDDLELASQVETTEPNLTYGLEREVFCEKRERLRQFGDITFSPSVVDDERFLAISRETIALRKLSGETLWTSRAPAGRMLDEARLSRDGSRVAVRLLRGVLYHEPVNWDGNGSPANDIQASAIQSAEDEDSGGRGLHSRLGGSNRAAGGAGAGAE